MSTELRHGMLARWRRLWIDRAAPDPTMTDEAFERLYLLYTDPARGYHGLDHIRFCLDEFETVRHLARHKHALEAAIWWHDVIYDPKRGDNEQKSMEFAEQELVSFGESPHFIAKVSGNIMATVHKGGIIDTDQQLICDIDLAGLGTPNFEIMRANSRGIRKEYSFYPEADYVKGRTAILNGFADRDSMYYTPHFRAKYTEQAKQNIRREVAELPELAKFHFPSFAI
ncbi:MAG: N-methyl-D-aspartate receptor NMDAR2C subunit [Candidatus Pacebacteria bacterium]|nr:N-methyl-D-aspartate receptor NMDAR2C subunit [Candidatus Paceibacterota bacterium]